MEPYVKETAEMAVRNDKPVEKSIRVNHIIFGYNKTPYIKENYKSEWDEPIYRFMILKISEVNDVFRDKLPAFHVEIRTDRIPGFFRADHRIRISLKVKKIVLTYCCGYNNILHQYNYMILKFSFEKNRGEII